LSVEKMGNAGVIDQPTFRATRRFSAAVKRHGRRGNEVQRV